MNSLAHERNVPHAVSVKCTDKKLVVSLVDGRELSVPLAWFPRLEQATATQRANYELLGEGEGVHWPELDEDISIEGLLQGQRAVR